MLSELLNIERVAGRPHKSLCKGIRRVLDAVAPCGLNQRHRGRRFVEIRDHREVEQPLRIRSGLPGQERYLRQGRAGHRDRQLFLGGAVQRTDQCPILNLVHELQLVEKNRYSRPALPHGSTKLKQEVGEIRSDRSLIRALKVDSEAEPVRTGEPDRLQMSESPTDPTAQLCPETEPVECPLRIPRELINKVRVGSQLMVKR